MDKTPLEAAQEVIAKHQGQSVVVESSFGPWARRFTNFLLCGVILALGMVLETQGDIRTAQNEGRERGFINRAQDCRIQVLLGAELDSDCLVPEVTAYFDPNESPSAGVNSAGQQANRRLLCMIVDSLGHQSPDCGQ